MNKPEVTEPNERYNLANKFLARLGGCVAKEINAIRISLDFIDNPFVDPRDQRIFSAYCAEMNEENFVFGTRAIHPFGKDRTYPYFFLKLLPWKKIIGEEKLKEISESDRKNSGVSIHTSILKGRYRNYWMGSIGVINANEEGELVITRDTIHYENVRVSAQQYFPRLDFQGRLTYSEHTDRTTGKKLLDSQDMNRYVKLLRKIFETTTSQRRERRREIAKRTTSN